MSRKYQPRSKKKVLPFNSAHSKSVKGGIASSLMEAYLAKSCKHAMNSSFCNQVNCLKLANYPEHFLKEVAKTLVSKMKEKTEKACVSRKKTKTVVYIQKLSHNHSSSSSNRVFSAPSVTFRPMLENQQQKG